MTLDEIADDVGTTTDEQRADSHDRLHEGGGSDDLRDRANEYDGGWSVDH